MEIQRFPMIRLHFVVESLPIHSRFLVTQLTGMSIKRIPAIRLYFVQNLLWTFLKD